MIRKVTALVMVLCLIEGGAAGWAAILYVDDDACPASGTGGVDDPYCSIQTAIDLAQPGDTVRVAEGVYTNKATRPITAEVPVFPNPATAVVFMRDQVHLEGAGPGRSVLDAGGEDRVVIFENIGAGTRFEGFTVTGGDTTERVGDGAGLLILFGAPIISHNLIVGNHAFFGGGVAVLYADPEIRENVIAHNTAGNDIQSSTGGGIDVAFDAHPVITSNVIAGNYVNGSGGGLAIYETNAVVESNRIEGNVAEVNGGGVFSAPTANQFTGAAELVGNIISMNVSRGGHGGGVFASEDTAQELNTISHNRAAMGDGGGVFTLGPQGISLRQNIIAHNGAISGGGVFIDPSSDPTVTDNDVFGNLPTEYGGALDPTGSQGNISADPLLMNAPDFVADVQIDRFNNLVTATDSEPARQFALGDVVEYGDDGIPRTVTEIKTAVGVPLIKLVTVPLITQEEIVLHPVVLRRWGGNTLIGEDFGVRPDSPIVDIAANGTHGPPLDALGHTREFDGDLDGQDRIDLGAAESLAELPRLDLDPAGALLWQPYSGLAWHYHLYRGLASALRDADGDGLPDGPDAQPGTSDDGYGECLVPGLTLYGPAYTDTDMPQTGQIFFYLATIADSGEGILGFDSDDRVRPNLQPCD